MPNWATIRVVVFVLGTLAPLGCRPPPSETQRITRGYDTPEISSDACPRYAGRDLDVALDGSPRVDVRCCESDYGFDPQLAATSCGLGEYLGESEELACVHRFTDVHGQLHELRLTPIVGLEFAAAVALHESGEFSEDHVAGPLPEQPETWLSSSPTRHWALIPGWTATRRLSWDHASCSPTDMLPVLAAMRDAAAPETPTTPLPRLEIDAGASAPAPADSLLARYADAQPSAASTFALPSRAGELVDATMHAVAREDLDAFTRHVHEHARWGLPDRRQLAARPIADGAGVIAALRRAAARLPGQLQLHCPALDRRVSPAVGRGEQPMWCVWASPDQLDLIVFAIRGRIVEGQPDARIEYIGLFPDAPVAPLIVPAEPPPPPVRPLPQIICGDPHAIDYPGLCPELEIEDDDEGEGENGENGEATGQQ